MGGNAIKMASRINQTNVSETLSDVYCRLLPALGISLMDVAILGSTGKKRIGESSGDIDLGISIGALMDVANGSDIFDLVVSKTSALSPEIKDLRGAGLISIAWPIANTDGEQQDEFVQLDLMLVDSLEWASWAYYSPSYNDSSYKGLFRNEIMYAVARQVGYVVKESVGGEAVIWDRCYFDLGKGFLKGTQTRIGKNGINKNPKTVGKMLVSKNPMEVSRMLFADEVCPTDCLTWEQAISLLRSPSFKHIKVLPEIIEQTTKGILSKKQPLPKELIELKRLHGI